MSRQSTSESADLAPNGWPHALLEGFRRGDRQALTAVYRRHVEEVARMLRRGFSFEAEGRTRRFVGFTSPFEFHDALHETFLRAFDPRARQRYDGIRPYGPYVRTIAKNVALRSFRAKELSFPELDANTGAVLPEPQATPEQTVARQQTRTVVQAFLDRQSASDHELLRLRFVEGRSQRDVAEMLGTTRQRLRTRERRLKAALLQHLRNQGTGGDLTTLLPLIGPELLHRLTEVLS